MITTIVILFYVALFLFGIGFVLAILSSLRDGCIHKDIAEIKGGLAWVFLEIKNFTQQIFNRTTYKHLINYYMYYGLAMGFVILIIAGL